MDFEGLQNLLPILFLIFWAIVGAQAKKRTQRQDKSSPQPPGKPLSPGGRGKRPGEMQRQRSPQGQRPSPRGPLFESMRETLQEVWGDLSEAVNEDMPGAPVKKPSVHDKLDQKQEERRDRLSKAERKRTQRTGETISVRDRLEQAPQIAMESTSSTRVEKPRIARDISSSFSSGTVDLQEAIVWSEILGKPIALREDMSGL